MDNLPFSKNLIELPKPPSQPKAEATAISMAPPETVRIISNIKIKQYAIDFMNRLVADGIVQDMKKASILEKVVALVESENQ